MSPQFILTPLSIGQQQKKIKIERKTRKNKTIYKLKLEIINLVFVR